MERIIGYGEGYTIHELYTMHPQFLSGKQVVLKVTVVWQLNQRYQKCRTPRQPESATS
jgi:hypothetical protein